MSAARLIPPSVLTFLRWYQRKLRRALNDVWKASYAFIAVIVLNVAIPRTSQGVELTRAPGEFGAGHLVLMAVGLTYCAVGIWLASAISLTHATPTVRNGRRSAGTLASTVPFWFGVLVAMSAFGLVTGNGTHVFFGWWHVDDATMLNVAALLLLLLIPFAPHRFDGTKNTPRMLIAPRRAARMVHGHLEDHRVVYEIALVALGGTIFLAALIDPVAVGRTLTTWVVAYVALAFWPLWGSRVFIAWPKLYGWPSFWAFPIVLALVFSNWNDNHEIDRGPAADTRPVLRSFDDAIADWRRRSCATDSRCPMIVVAAEGGGLRAAYWTASVLSELDAQTNGSFSDGVFALTSVSGGSLGGFAYYAGRTLKPNGCDAGQRVLDYLGDDHLAPVMSALVFGNALQWLLPFRVTHLDRARAFEVNMSARWQADVEDPCRVNEHAFDAPFPRQRSGFPFLFLNSTNVETGKRFILSTVDKPNRPDDVVGRDTYWAFDPALSLNLGSIPVRTAVTLSASFPLITPAGAAYPHDASGRRGRLWGRLVDGGYFDGTALMTAYDIADAVHARDKTIPLAIVFISNDPSSAAGWENARDDIPRALDPPAKLLITDDSFAAVANAAPAAVPAYPPWGYEVNGIVSAGLNAHWEGAIETARRRLAGFRTNARQSDTDACRPLFSAPKGEVFCEISLGKLLRGTQDPRPALGWWLSAESKMRMRALAKCHVRQLAMKPACDLPTDNERKRAISEGLQ